MKPKPSTLRYSAGAMSARPGKGPAKPKRKKKAGSGARPEGARAPKMTAAERRLWQKTPKEYRSIYEGKRYVLRLHPQTGATTFYSLSRALADDIARAKAGPQPRTGPANPGPKRKKKAGRKARPRWETEGILIDQSHFPRLRKLSEQAERKWKKAGSDAFWGARLSELSREHTLIVGQMTVKHPTATHRDWTNRAHSLTGRYCDFIRAMDYQIAHPEQFPPWHPAKAKRRAAPKKKATRKAAPKKKAGAKRPRAPRKTAVGKRAAELKAARSLAHSIAAAGGNFDEAERVYWQKHRSYPKGLVQKSMLRGWDEGRQAYLQKQQPHRAAGSPKYRRVGAKHNPGPKKKTAKKKAAKKKAAPRKKAAAKRKTKPRKKATAKRKTKPRKKATAKRKTKPRRKRR